MTTPVAIINNGLSKIAASRISSIDPPRTSTERFMDENYPFWRDAELSARRWRFALRYDVLVKDGDELEGFERPHRFLIPTDALRPVRERTTSWEQRGTYLYDREEKLTALFIIRAKEVTFDPLFSEVLACKVAFESAEYLTQSNKKKEAAFLMYKEAVMRAGRMNAFVTGSEELAGAEHDDTGFSWVVNRQGYLNY